MFEKALYVLEASGMCARVCVCVCVRVTLRCDLLLRLCVCVLCVRACVHALLHPTIAEIISIRIDSSGPPVREDPSLRVLRVGMGLAFLVS